MVGGGFNHLINSGADPAVDIGGIWRARSASL